MSELFFKIGFSGILGSLVIICFGFGVSCILEADDWNDKFFGIFMIVVSIFIGFIIVCLWLSHVRGLE